MSAIKTIPINNDEHFLAARETINPLLALYGYPIVTYKGSVSWLAGASDPGRSMETYFKLLYRGPRKPYVFGIREDVASGIQKLKAIRWPVEFSVMPKTQVLFCGFEFQPTEAALAAQRLEKILKAFPEPDPSLAIPLNSVTHADFDSQLNRL